ncbi:class D beta-lactamase [Thalassotalea mangrovi]|uniref:Beta-lactamase n=1 Tax=Thalassotalea mangrovi TaxID=2572245 RepID=A0A4U1B5G1_9GAMM|nr:class D beta-lactamase [Thalassotalea mangrovi]TKB45638.1 class D beta-lactamase [Thalassotalea mangrovi]
MRNIITLYIIFWVAHTANAQTTVSYSLQECQSSCTMLIVSDDNKTMLAHNPARAKQRMTPFSSFKIANTLIALDTAVVKNLEQKLTFDTQAYPVQSWWPENWYQRPLVIRDAFQYSAVPIYQQIATEISAPVMSQYLKQFSYGNQDISSGIDTFWLNESLTISAEEQIEFLQKLYRQELDLKADTYVKFKQIMLVESTSEYQLYAKTGGGQLEKGKALGWYVGYVVKDNEIYYFAFNMDAKTFADVQKVRVNTVRSELKKLGII